MKPKTSDNPTPRSLESDCSDDGAGTIGCLCSTCRSSIRLCSVRMFGHEKSNYAGYMLARHIKPKKIVFYSRLLPHETCGMPFDKFVDMKISRAAETITYLFGGYLVEPDHVE